MESDRHAKIMMDILRTKLPIVGAVLLIGLVTWLAISSGNRPTELAVRSTTGPLDQSTNNIEKNEEDAKLSVATFGGGCFWCVEAVLQRCKGVKSVVSGYAGGQTENPNYRDVCNGDTGHAEVVQVTYDANVLAFEDLLEIFWRTHDPTTLNRQGNDVGTQYRSVIFYHDSEQQRIAEEYKAKLDASGIFPLPIVTEISPLPKFYPAEDYHQNYFNDNPGNPYCQVVTQKKVNQLKKLFSEKIKDEYRD
jgi:peptide-methionine (S)-S-oxide reductase